MIPNGLTKHIWSELLLNEYELKSYDKNKLIAMEKEIYFNQLPNCSWEIVDNIVLIVRSEAKKDPATKTVVTYNIQYKYTQRYIQNLIEYYKCTDIMDLIKKWNKNEVKLNLKWY